VSNSGKHLEKVKAQFDEAEEYDQKMGQICPSHEPLLVSIVAAAKHLAQPRRILELGVGTGLLAQELLRAFPKAHLTAMDFSPRMIERASKRLSRFSRRIEMVEGDFYETSFSQGQDLVVSSYAIHHLSDIQKAQLYEKVYACLVDNGVFINGDCVIATSFRTCAGSMPCTLKTPHKRISTRRFATTRSMTSRPPSTTSWDGWIARVSQKSSACGAASAAP